MSARSLHSETIARRPAYGARHPIREERMLRRALFAAALLTTAATAAAAQSAPSASAAPAANAPAPQLADSADALALGRLITDWFWALEADSLYGRLDKSLQGGMRSPANLENQIFGFAGQFGLETVVLEEEAVREGDKWRYSRIARLDASEHPWKLSWTFTAEGSIPDVDLQPLN